MVTSYVVKFDSLGNRIWLRHTLPDDFFGASDIYTLCFLPGNRIAAVGEGRSSFSWGDIRLDMNGENFNYMQLAWSTLNQTTGEVLDAKRLGITPINEENPISSTALISHVLPDTYGNTYIAGTFSGNLILDTIALTRSGDLANLGEDVFFFKYGYMSGVYDPYILDSTWVRDTVAPKIIDTLYRDTLFVCTYAADTMVTTIVYLDTVMVDTHITNISFLCDTIIRDTLISGQKPGFFAQKGEPIASGRVLTDTLYMGTKTDTTITKDSNYVFIKGINQQKYHIEIFPNPVNEVVHIANKGNYPLQAELYDMVGKKVKSCIVSANTTYPLSVQSLHSGIYMLKLQIQGKEKTVKVVVH